VTSALSRTIYSRSNAGTQPRSTQTISKYPVISILLRIAEHVRLHGNLSETAEL
jgi:hypothetical protein